MLRVYTDVSNVLSPCGLFIPPPRILWGQGYGDCTTCRQDLNPAWTCPAAVNAYEHIGGSGPDILELDGDLGTRPMASIYVQYAYIVRSYETPVQTLRANGKADQPRRLGSLRINEFVFTWYDVGLGGEDARENQYTYCNG